jgi:hypothetical protein
MVVGYKGFKSDFTGHGGFKFEVGKTYVHEGKPINLCIEGFHFCVYAQDVHIYHQKDDTGDITRYAIIQASGEIIHGEDKSVCSCITIVKEITLDEICKSSTAFIKRLNGDEEWYENGVLHRDNDLPAIVYSSGSKGWLKNGLKHREHDRPALVTCGGREWWVDGQRHRDGDNPAIINENGEREWWVKGVRHRDEDLPSIIRPGVAKIWFKHGFVYRSGDKPAIMYDNGTMEWFDNNGVIHRDGGQPAHVGANGIRIYYVHGVRQKIDMVNVIDDNEKILIA